MESQNRLSRIQILGIGIVAGFQVSVNTDNGNRPVSISVSGGYGVTSKGFLFQFENQEFDYINPKASVLFGKFLCAGSTANADGIDIANELIDGVCEIRVAENVTQNQDFKEMALLEVEAPLAVHPCFQNKVLVVCQEEETVTRNSCFSDCDEKGEDRRFQYRWLLVPKEAMIRVWEIAFGDQGGEATNLPVNLTHDLFIECLGSRGQGEGIDLCSFISWEVYYRSYKEIIANAIPGIIHAYQEAAAEFGAAIPGFSTDVIDTLPAHLNSLSAQYPEIPTVGSLEDCPDIQYLYDYLKDLILAYQAFKKVANGMSIPDSTLSTSQNADFNDCLYPTYLALGAVNLDEQGDNVEIISDGPRYFDNCRTDNTGSGFQTVDQDRLELARCYFRKMLAIANGQNMIVPNLVGGLEKATVITPSTKLGNAKNNLAIPFYYRGGQVANVWNEEICKSKDWRSIPHYQRLFSEPPFDEHLYYHPNHYDFYRIEGHLGKELAEAKFDVEQLRKHYNLPFDIKTIHFDGDYVLELGENEIDCKELDLTLCVIIEDLECVLGELQQSFDGVVVDIRIVEEVEALLGLIANVDSAFSFEANKTAILDQIELVFGAEPSYPNCYTVPLTKVSEAFNEKYEALLNALLFHRFAESHTGLEHKAGVEKGGTFILVYKHEFNSTNFRSNVSKIPNQPAWLQDVGIDISDKDLLQLILENASPVTDPQVLAGISSNIRKTVVADFCLPYYCCSDAPIVNYEIKLVRATILVEKVVFCSDEEAMEGTVSPPGGVFTELPEGFTAIENAESLITGFTFNPQLVTSFEEGRQTLSLTYVYNGQSKSQVFTVYDNSVLADLSEADVICERTPICNQLFDQDGNPVPGSILEGFNFAFRLRDGVIPEEALAYVEVNWLIKLENGTFVPFEGELNLNIGETEPLDIRLEIANGPCKRSIEKTIAFCPTAEEVGIVLRENLGEDIPIDGGQSTLAITDEVNLIQFLPAISGGTLTITGPLDAAGAEIDYNSAVERRGDNCSDFFFEFSLLDQNGERFPLGDYTLTYSFPGCDSIVVSLELTLPELTLELAAGQSSEICFDGANNLVGLVVSPDTAIVRVISGAPQGAIGGAAGALTFDLNQVTFNDGNAQVRMVAENPGSFPSPELVLNIFKLPAISIVEESPFEDAVKLDNPYLYEELADPAPDRLCAMLGKRVRFAFDDANSDFANVFDWEIVAEDGQVILQSEDRFIEADLFLSAGANYEVRLSASVADSPCPPVTIDQSFSICPTVEELAITFPNNSTNNVGDTLLVNDGIISVAALDVQVQGGEFTLRAQGSTTELPTVIQQRQGSKPEFPCESSNYLFDYSDLPDGFYELQYRLDECDVVGETLTIEVQTSGSSGDFDENEGGDEVTGRSVELPLNQEVTSRTAALSTETESTNLGQATGDERNPVDKVLGFLEFNGTEDELNAEVKQLTSSLIKRMKSSSDKAAYEQLLEVTAKHYLNQQMIVSTDEVVADGTVKAVQKLAQQLNDNGIKITKLRRVWGIKGLRDTTDSKRPSRIHKLFKAKKK
ncbi:MAG: hypothetical protein AAFO03_23460, partial [Bacteroidota bacterium]